ncbi:hypothetical protein [Brucella anthropi]|uniref:Uncharacterized protein n=1 Tax=Brucella anthropi TaxID=529 RepID=A0A6L3Z9I5_BRUAN|nr:hypothetical protein [Brucella anthropi]KAB2772426.1 hypothetical protein F9L04_06805 [Brucella anthropi]UVV69945.1 hypothetical protein NW321_15335 [Brucella anthropi]
MKKNPIKLYSVSTEEVQRLVTVHPLEDVARELGLTLPRLIRFCKAKKIALPRPTESLIGKNPTAKSKPIKPMIVALDRDDSGLDDLKKLHPLVRENFNDYVNLQSERLREIWLYIQQGRTAHPNPRPDFTAMDIRRIRAMSTFCHAIEKSGCVLTAAWLQGDINARLDDIELEFRIVEKMKKSPGFKDQSWTAIRDNVRPGLQPTDFLRVKLLTWISGKQPEWVEDNRITFCEVISDVVANIPPLVEAARQWRLKCKADEERWERERHEKYERQRLKEIDEKRWQTFIKNAKGWRQYDLLTDFIAEIERRMDDPSIEIDDRPASEWLHWARQRLADLDPFRDGADGIFTRIAAIKERWQ